MKNFKTFITEAKKCPPGKYYCFTDKKCKKIPMGYRIGYGGRLAPDNDEKKNGNGKNGNGNGNGMVMAPVVTVVVMVVVMVVATEEAVNND